MQSRPRSPGIAFDRSADVGTRDGTRCCSTFAGTKKLAGLDRLNFGYFVRGTSYAMPALRHTVFALNHDSSRISVRRRIALVSHFECLAIMWTVCPSAKLARNWLSCSRVQGSLDRDVILPLPTNEAARAACCRSANAELLSWIPNFATLRSMVSGDALNLAAIAFTVGPFKAIKINCRVFPPN